MAIRRKQQFRDCASYGVAVTVAEAPCVVVTMRFHGDARYREFLRGGGVPRNYRKFCAKMEILTKHDRPREEDESEKARKREMWFDSNKLGNRN